MPECSSRTYCRSHEGVANILGRSSLQELPPPVGIVPAPTCTHSPRLPVPNIAAWLVPSTQVPPKHTLHSKRRPLAATQASRRSRHRPQPPYPLHPRRRLDELPQEDTVSVHYPGVEIGGWARRREGSGSVAQRVCRTPPTPLAGTATTRGGRAGAGRTLAAGGGVGNNRALGRSR